MSIRPATIGGPSMSGSLSGFFTTPVSILRATLTQNDVGEPVPTWAPLVGHCELDALVAGGDVSVRMKKQEFRTGSVAHEMEYRRVLIIGAYSQIDHADRVRIADRDWAIVSLVIDLTNTFTELLCESLEPGNL